MVDEKTCIGCQACFDLCPAKAIKFIYDQWGEGRAYADAMHCIECGLCDNICPDKNIDKFKPQKTVFAAISKVHSKTGSSGGIFYEIARRFVSEGGAVFGAAFNDDLKLVHKKATTLSEIIPLCTSKYIHSDMSGVYNEIKITLHNGKKVMFVGTPCQASAVKNIFGEKYRDSLFIIDFLCHGTGTQKIFDYCIYEEEKKKHGKITEFIFRAKSRSAEHSFSYKINRDGEERIVSGYHFEFPYYNAYLKYSIFNDACYRCQYATGDRVADITLGDFWKIQKYDKKFKDKNGVSMILVNSEKGKIIFDSIKSECIIREFPVCYASANNVSLCQSESFPNEKNRLLGVLESDGYPDLVHELECQNIKKNIVYTKTPKLIKKIYKKLRGKS